MVDYTLGMFTCQVVGWVENGGPPLEPNFCGILVSPVSFDPVVGWVESGDLPPETHLFWHSGVTRVLKPSCRLG
jgi:hypothetical protein